MQKHHARLPLVFIFAAPFGVIWPEVRTVTAFTCQFGIIARPSGAPFPAYLRPTRSPLSPGCLGCLSGAALLCIALRVQRVDGRRADVFVADLRCSRVQSGAAPTVSNVSARAQRGIGSCEC